MSIQSEQIEKKKSLAIDKSPVKILLVEDDLIVKKVVKATLERLSCDVDVAETGRAAVDLSNQSVYDLILMDVGLPDQGGCETTRLIRKTDRTLNRWTPIIALTAHVGVDQSGECLASGMDMVINKPFLPDMAKKILEDFVYSRRCAI